ncbi:MAG: recombinase family protein, partial [Candidatus Omnitrophica bacterium]|nr:recombinase family protein [Candidatus Omnitrophota bacterium]
MNKQNKTNISTASSRLHLPQVHGPEPIIRCVIYTRKSTHEGIEKDFTSLDSQRESAENYIASQKNQGWIALEEKYDDYGFTGANMERPALERLLKDIEDGKIDCVVVYKVDRLSRSLLDFSNLLNMFEQHNVTFVSITQ